MRPTRPLTVCAALAWSLIALACVGNPVPAPKGTANQRTEPVTANVDPVVEPTSQPRAPAPARPAGLSEAEKSRRREAWRAGLEERADELAARAEAAETRLSEREATYKRRTADGLLDYTCRDEIAQLKKDIPKIWAELAAVENELATGPPESLFVVTEPARDEIPARQPSAPAVQSPPTADTLPAYSGTVSAGKVHVNGYYRKDGTYVRPHTRSSPRR